MPTKDQIEAYRADGFVVVEEFLPGDEVARVLGRFEAVFGHEWSTGIAPDEVNYVPGVTPPEHTRQLCNVWKADPVIAQTTLAERNARFAAELAGLAGVRIVQDNLIWKPPSGAPLLAHQDGAYLSYLDPPNMVTCWMALDATDRDTGTIFYARGSHLWPKAPPGGQFHAPDDWLAWLRSVKPDQAELDLVPIEVPPGGAAFHDAWIFHGSPANLRGDAQRRAVISHLMDAGTRFSEHEAHPVYSRYRKPDDSEMDEAFFPVLWSEDGGRSNWLTRYLEEAPRDPT